MSMISDSTPAPFLGKRKGTDECRSHFAGESKRGPKVTKEGEASDSKKLGFINLIGRVCEEFREAKESGALEEGDDKEEEDDEPCEICKGKGHWHYFCPWSVEIPPCRGIPAGIPSVYEVVCKRCWSTKHEGETGDCANCGCEFKMVRPKICPLCLDLGHKGKTHKDCLAFFGNCHS